MSLSLQNSVSLVLAAIRSGMDLLEMLVVSHLVWLYARFWKLCRQQNQSLRVSPLHPHSSFRCWSSRLEPTSCSSISVYSGHLVVVHGALSRDTGTRKQSRTSSFSIFLSRDLLRDEHRAAAPRPTRQVYPVPQLRPHSFKAASVGGVVSAKVPQQTQGNFCLFTINIMESAW